MTRVSPAEFARIRRIAAERKAKREEKRAALPWGQPPAYDPEKDGPWTKGRTIKSGGTTWVIKKRRSPSPRELLRAKLDSLWAFLVKLRDRLAFGGLCRICGIRPIEVAYHLIPRGDDATRWLPENGVGACARCNRGEQLNRSRYRAKHVRLFGAALIERLEARARTAARFSLDDLEAMHGRMVRAIQDLGGHR